MIKRVRLVALLSFSGVIHMSSIAREWMVPDLGLKAQCCFELSSHVLREILPLLVSTVRQTEAIATLRISKYLAGIRISSGVGAVVEGRVGLPLPFVFEFTVGMELGRVGVLLGPVGAMMFGLELEFVGLLLLLGGL